MTVTDTADTYTDQLRQLLDGRMNSGRELAAAAERLRIAREAVNAAEQDYMGAFNDAMRAGWSEAELRKVFKTVGVDAPTRTRRSRGRGRALTAAPTGTGGPADTSSAGAH